MPTLPSVLSHAEAPFTPDSDPIRLREGLTALTCWSLFVSFVFTKCSSSPSVVWILGFYFLFCFFLNSLCVKFVFDNTRVLTMITMTVFVFFDSRIQQLL